ncbi:MAG: NB-ARC domain-containing protein [Isosphaeraceae bacterium]
MGSFTIRAFVSSTWLDLGPEREAVDAALQRLRETKLVGMEYFGSRDETTQRMSLEEVRRSDVYVGIIGARYGSGITVDEYQMARERNLPCFIYFKDEAHIAEGSRELDPVKVRNLAEFKEALRSRHSTSDFRDPNELAAKLTADLHRWIFDHYLPRCHSSTVFQAPPLPAHYVQRKETTEAIKADLLSASSHAGVLVVSAIHGLAGIGKTTLAAAVCHDDEVRSEFDDGIYWTTLGQQPDLLSLLSNLIRSIDEADTRVLTIEAASAKLRTLLRERNALLVVDDAWESTHVRPFLVGGPRCRILITTREAHIASALSAARHDLDVMTHEQAMNLFCNKLGRPVSGREQRHASRLALTVGYLPLALEIAAALISEGVAWEELLADLSAEIARLDSLSIPTAEDIRDEAERGRLSLIASFELSLRRLSEESRRRFAWLGVVQEDASINENVAATIWEVKDVRDARDVLRLFRSKSLLLAGVPRENGTPTYRLHDLIHDLARRLLTYPMTSADAKHPYVLGIPLKQANGMLIDRYRSQLEGRPWHALSDDSYIHSHLAWHFEQAGAAEALFALLGEETAEGRNGWYQARDRMGQLAGYLEDVARAWRLAETLYATSRDPVALGLQYRFALIRSTFNSLAGNIRPCLLAELVRRGVWPPSQGLASAQQVPNAPRRAAALASVAPHLPTSLLREALSTVKAFHDDSARSHTLIGLAPYVPLSLVAEAIALTHSIQSPSYRAKTLAPFAARMAELGYPDEALSIADMIDIDEDIACALIGLSRHISPSRLRDAFARVSSIKEEGDRASAIVGIAPRLDPTFLEVALALARGIGNRGYRARALAGLALAITEPDRNSVLLEGLTAARQITSEENRTAVLTWLATYLPASLSEQLLTASAYIQDEGRRARVLAAYAVLAPPARTDRALSEALSLARSVRRRYQLYDQANLAAIAPYFAKAGRELMAWEIIRSIRSAEHRAEAIKKSVPHFGEQIILNHVLPSVQAGRDRWNLRCQADELAAVIGRLIALSRSADALLLVPKIPEGDSGDGARLRLVALLTAQEGGRFLAEAIGVAKSTTWSRDTAMDMLYPIMTLDLIREELEATQTIGDGEYRAIALASLAPHLPLSAVREAACQAEASSDHPYRTRVIAAMARRLPSAERKRLLQESLKSARAIGNPQERAKTLADLAPLLSRWDLTTRELRDVQFHKDEEKKRKDKPSAINGPILALDVMPPDSISSSWCSKIRSLASFARRKLLSELPSLVPLVIALNCPEALTETYFAIRDVGRWWP